MMITPRRLVSGIYCIVYVETLKVYVGSSSNVPLRFTQHKTALRHGKHENPILQAAWNKYGEDAFDFVWIEFVPVSKLLKEEQRYIVGLDALDRMLGFNICPLAACPPAWTGKKHSEATRAKMRANHSGGPNSESSRAKISAARTGSKATEETKARMKASAMFRVHSPESISQGAAKRIGKKRTPEQRAKMSLAQTRRYSTKGESIGIPTDKHS